MNTVFESFAAVFGVLLITELAAGLCTENAMIRFTRALVALTLLTSVITGFFSVEWGLSFSPREAPNSADALTGYLEDQAEDAVRDSVRRYLLGLLAAAELKPEKFRVDTDIDGGGSIVLTRVSAAFRFPVEAERAQALLRSVLGDETELEVVSNGP